MMAGGTRIRRQIAIHDWVRRTFGHDVSINIQERAIRVLEEAIEVAQAAGVEPDMIQRMAERVYAKEPGELPKELGQLGLVILALASAAGHSADRLEEEEVEHVLSLPADHFRKRFDAKKAMGLAAAC